MSLSTYFSVGALVVTGIVTGYFAIKDRTKQHQLDAAVAMVDIFKRDRDIAVETAKASEAVIAQMKAFAERQADVIAKSKAEEAKRSWALKQALKRINDAPKSDDGVIAPVLRRELDGLRLDGVGKPRADGAGKAGTDQPAAAAEPLVPAETAIPGS